jgi:mRNA-degrading endonuclease RelE of RelBE toxin-antitoxin system
LIIVATPIKEQQMLMWPQIGASPPLGHVLDDPRSIGEALKGSRLGVYWKYRVGDYRVIANIEDGALRILVVRIGNRREVYR